jgi:hypothetical protein
MEKYEMLDKGVTSVSVAECHWLEPEDYRH